MKWKVKISGDKSSLEMISQGFSNSSIKIVFDNGDFYLESSSFNVYDEMKYVYQKADEIVKWINGSMLHAIGFSGGIEIERIIAVSDDNVHCTYNDICGSLIVRSQMSFRLEKGDGTTIEYSPDIENFEKWIELAQKDANVAKVLRLLGGKPYDWVNLYKIYEVVKSDTGEALLNQWVTEREIRLFRQTANSVGALGDECRHGAEQTQAPKNPMTLSEARYLIKGILYNWRQIKIDLEFNSDANEGGDNCN